MIRTCVAGSFEGWSGDTTFDLCNGQVWVQVSYAYAYHYAYRPSVTITRTTLGWLMSVSGMSQSIAVKQVAVLARSCISGAFQGWTGQTVFPLCNGQIWQQAEYAYYYHYAYQPNVLVYEDASGLADRLSVDGADRTIRVVRIR